MSTATHIKTVPVAGALGVEISGVNLAEDLNDSVISEIRQALLDHLVIFFRDQELTPEEHLRFARKFGDLEEHDFVKGLPGNPEILRLVKEADEAGHNFGGSWHSDVTYQEAPALGSILYAIDVPPAGGDTLFANQFLAYDTLSDGMKELLDGLVCIHSAKGIFGVENHADKKFKHMTVEPSEKADEEVEHPVVRTHPESGRKGLFVNRNFSTYFKGMTMEESAPIMNFLFEHSKREAFTCRFRWQKGSVAFWDNRSVMHFALNDYTGHRREMHRVTVSGDRPY
jgi:taurine dioxygenase